MKIGFDLAQASGTLTGCGWYASALLVAMADATPENEFLEYRHFGRWLNDPGKLAALPSRANMIDPLSGCSMSAAASTWQQALAAGQTPGQPALVHSTSFQAPRLRKTKLVVTIFDLSFWTVPEFTTDQIRLHCQSGVLDALENADGLVFISDHARREFEAILPRYRRLGDILTTVTPLASRWVPRPAPVEQSGDYWLFVGSMEPRKNIHALLDAYESYARHHPAPRPLWLAGASGWKNESMHTRLRQMEARGWVRSLGYVGDEQLRQLYCRAHALIFPSWYEGFGLPVLEAMSQGCPVICSDRSSLPEVGGDAVHWIDPASPTSIADGMRRLEGDANYRQELARRGLTRAATFTWQRAAKQTLAFYDNVISTAPKFHE